MIVLLLMATLAAPCDLPANDDVLAHELRTVETCPRDVFAFRNMLIRNGGRLETALVANRGFHNPALGSFSMFEMVLGRDLEAGDAFFGHFTTPAGTLLTPEQAPTANALMIEAFAFDPHKGVYNFYELRGDGTTGQWFYRGDSVDILADTRELHLADEPHFGTRLRCSGCHVNGGPIMKELTAPHNDWWEPKRGLDFAGRTPDARISEVLKTLVPAARLAEAVKRGTAKLEASEAFQKARTATSLREQLRPLFCPVELNFESDTALTGDVTIPAGFFVDPRLHKRTVKISRAAYDAELRKADSTFPETKNRDADHAWLTPVKAASDIAVIDELVRRGVISNDLVADILAVDFTEPVFSAVRCGLLRAVPTQFSPGWASAFTAELATSSLPGAKELRENIVNPERTPLYHARRAAAFITACTANKLDALYGQLVQRREAVLTSQISKNPKGQILEPGFRVIFPEADKAFPRMHLNERCEPR